MQKANKIPLGLNFFNTVNETYNNIGNGLDQCVLEANAAYKTMGNSLYAFEIGNEVDGKLTYDHIVIFYTAFNSLDQVGEMASTEKGIGQYNATSTSGTNLRQL